MAFDHLVTGINWLKQDDAGNVLAYSLAVYKVDPTGTSSQDPKTRETVATPLHVLLQSEVYVPAKPGLLGDIDVQAETLLQKMTVTTGLGAADAIPLA